MARTVIGVNDPKAVKAWSSLLAYDVSQESYWQSRMMGRGENAYTPAQILTDLETGAGEAITYQLLAEMRMAPVFGEDRLEGKEERQRFFTDQIYIDNVRCGVDGGGTMTRKRSLHNLREKARIQIADWWTRLQDELCFVYAAGARGVNSNFLLTADFSGFPIDGKGDIQNPLSAPDANHTIYGGDATAFNNLDATDKMTLEVLEKAINRAETQGGGATDIPVLKPCKIGGTKCYVFVMHTWQEDDFRKSTGDAGWLALQKAAAGADGGNSPLFRKALGMHRGVLLHSHRNVIRFNNAGPTANVEAARGLFMGAQALVLAFGLPGTDMRFKWYEEMDDRGDRVVITSNSILGVKASKFNIGGTSQNLGLFGVDTACASR